MRPPINLAKLEATLEAFETEPSERKPHSIGRWKERANSVALLLTVAISQLPENKDLITRLIKYCEYCYDSANKIRTNDEVGATITRDTCYILNVAAKYYAANNDPAQSVEYYRQIAERLGKDRLNYFSRNGRLEEVIYLSSAFLHLGGAYLNRFQGHGTQPFTLLLSDSLGEDSPTDLRSEQLKLLQEEQTEIQNHPALTKKFEQAKSGSPTQKRPRSDIAEDTAEYPAKRSKPNSFAAAEPVIVLPGGIAGFERIAPAAQPGALSSSGARIQGGAAWRRPISASSSSSSAAAAAANLQAQHSPSPAPAVLATIASSSSSSSSSSAAASGLDADEVDTKIAEYRRSLADLFETAGGKIRALANRLNERTAEVARLEKELSSQRLLHVDNFASLRAEHDRALEALRAQHALQVRAQAEQTHRANAVIGLLQAETAAAVAAKETAEGKITTCEKDRDAYWLELERAKDRIETLERATKPNTQQAARIIELERKLAVANESADFHKARVSKRDGLLDKAEDKIEELNDHIKTEQREHAAAVTHLIKMREETEARLKELQEVARYLPPVSPSSLGIFAQTQTYYASTEAAHYLLNPNRR